MEDGNLTIDLINVQIAYNDILMVAFPFSFSLFECVFIDIG